MPAALHQEIEYWHLTQKSQAHEAKQLQRVVFKVYFSFYEVRIGVLWKEKLQFNIDEDFQIRYGAANLPAFKFWDLKKKLKFWFKSGIFLYLCTRRKTSSNLKLWKLADLQPLEQQGCLSSLLKVLINVEFELSLSRW